MFGHIYIYYGLGHTIYSTSVRVRIFVLFANTADCLQQENVTLNVKSAIRNGLNSLFIFHFVCL